MNGRRRLLKEYIRDDADEELDYLTIIPYSDGEPYVSKIAIYQPYVAEMTDGTIYYGNIWYSVDGGEWILYGGEFIDVPCFSKVRFKGNWHEVMKDVEYTGDNVSEFYTPYFYSESSSDWWLLEGTPLSLIHGDNFKERKNDWNYFWDTFNLVFCENMNIGQINNPKTFLPSTEINEGCYQAMFASSAIRNAPELPAETLKVGCYFDMFRSCLLLEEAPTLNAKTLVPYCYSNMFYNCPNLRYAKISATDGFSEEYALDRMFYNNAEFGLLMLSQELIDAGVAFPDWAIISEDYPTNEQGYPEAKGTIKDYNTLCFNAGFEARYTEGDLAVNLFLSEANELKKELFDYVRYEFDKNRFYDMAGIFINRCPMRYVMWFDYEYNGETLECVQFSDTKSDMNWIGSLLSDGSLHFNKYEQLIYDYIK